MLNLVDTKKEVRRWRSECLPAWWKPIEIAELLIAEVEQLRQRLLTAAGDDLCRLSQEEIKAMSSGGVPIPPKEEFLASCERFHAQVAGESGVNQNCLTLAQLIAENERLRAIVAAIEPGTLQAMIVGLWNFAERECGHSPVSSRPPILAIEDEIKRLRALVKDAYIEGYGHLGSWVQRESSWNASQSKKKLG